MRDGITASVIFVPHQSHHTTLFQFFCHQFAHISADEWLKRFQASLITTADGTPCDVTAPYQGGQHLYYYRALPNEDDVPFDHHLIYENEHILVVDKPHFLTVSPSGQYVQQTLLTRLKRDSGNRDLSPIHRLDRETAGLIMFAKHPKARAPYQQLFAQRQIDKMYHAIAPYRADLPLPHRVSARMQRGEPFYTMQLVEGEVNSITDIALIEQRGPWCKYCLQPLTGKQHQLRVHMASLGIAIVNDSLYPKILPRNVVNDFGRPLQLLAKQLQFIDPFSRQNMRFESQFELDFRFCEQ